MKIEVTLEDMGDVTEFARLLAPLVGGKALGQAQKASGTAPAPVQQAAAPPPVQAPAPPQPPIQAPTPPQPAQQVPTTAPAYTLDDLGRAGVALQQAGKAEEVRALVSSFGVESLQQLPEAQYGAFATALRSLGAPI